MNLNEFSTLAGGAAKGFEAGQNMRINSQDAQIRREAADRAKREYELNDIFRQIFSERAALDAPAQPAAPASPSAGALPTPNVGGAPVNAAPVPPAGTPAVASPALPAPQGAGAAPPSPVAAAVAPVAQPTRRERYDAWRSQALQAAARAGGLQGAKLFEDYENAISRRQMLSYAGQAITAMAGGQVGQAAKLLNTALEVSPVDTAMEWVAYDGKLYLKGADGTTSAPYSQEAVEGIIRRYMMTPEDYLSWQQQILNERQLSEVERHNLEAEGLTGRQIDVSERFAGVQEGQLELDKKYRGRETTAAEANALANLIQAKGYAERYRLAGLAQQAENKGWTPSQILTIMKDADNWEQDVSQLLPGSEEAFRENPQAFTDFKSDVIDQMTYNSPGLVTREQAGLVSQFLRRVPGVDYSQFTDSTGKLNPGILQFAENRNTGDVLVTYDGKSWLLPPGLADQAKAFKAAPGGAATPPGGGALPAAEPAPAAAGPDAGALPGASPGFSMTMRPDALSNPRGVGTGLSTLQETLQGALQEYRPFAMRQQAGRGDPRQMEAGVRAAIDRQEKEATEARRRAHGGN